jgi:WD40 repeat protein
VLSFINLFHWFTQQSGRSCSYSVYNRKHHTFLQVRIIFSSLNNIICTVDCNNNIYGWTVDGKEPMFEVSRHKALITDIIAIDKHNMFATCSLDKRIVLWSQTTRRVKGVLLGHKRGVTRLSSARDVLLTSGFECEARYAIFHN